MQPGFTTVYVLTHYDHVNGDMMANPQVMIGRLDGQFYPLGYSNDYLGDNVEIISDQLAPMSHIKESLQHEIVELCEMAE